GLVCPYSAAPRCCHPRAAQWCCHSGKEFSMTRVAADISMSLDGFITGPSPGLQEGLGTGGEAIQGWVFNSHISPPDREFLENAGANTGAVIMGRRTFDFVDGPHGWNAEVNYSYDHQTPSTPPVFVVTHAMPT